MNDAAKKRRMLGRRGAAAYMVALGMTTFLGIAAMAVDFGMWFVARSEAQRAAEAGAHAGASIFVTAPNNVSGARIEAERFAEMNDVRGVTPDVLPDVDIDVIPDSQKVRVRVQRSAARSNPLQTLFARAMGLDNVNIGASAAAQAWPGSSTDCILPFAIPDRWLDYDETLGALRPSQIGDVYGDNPNDYYEPGPTGTGYEAMDIGQELQLTTADPGETPMPGWYYAIAFPLTSGANDYRAAIRDCWRPTGETSLGDGINKEPGNMQGPTRQGFGDIFNDPNEQNQTWSTALGCPVSATDTTVCLSSASRRVRPLVMFDPRVYEDIDQGRREVPISNIAGVWLKDWDGNNAVTVVWMYYTAIQPAAGWEGGNGSLLRVLRIVE